MEEVELTQSQLLLWTGQQLYEDSPLYNMAFLFTLNGALDIFHFQKAFDKLVDVTDVLRTVFHNRDGNPYQKVLPTLPYRMDILDWTIDRPEDFRIWAKERTARKMDISRCCFDVALIKRSETQYFWYFNQHHLITDGWSVTLVFALMAEFYRLSIQGRLKNAQSLPQFAEYIASEASEKQVRHDTYWFEKLQQSALPPKLYGRQGTVAGTACERIILDLGKEHTLQLKMLAAEPDVRSFTKDLTLFNIFASIVFVYLYRISAQSEIIIGTPSHNRTTGNFKNTIGLFIQLFPISIQVGSDDTFATILEKTKIESNNFLRYAHSGANNPSLSKGFNVVLNYINKTFSDFDQISFQSEWIQPGHCDPKHHLGLQVVDFDNTGAIKVYFDCNMQVFDHDLKNLAPLHFLQLLDAFITDRYQLILNPSILSQAEKIKLVFDFNKADHFPDAPVDVLLLIAEQLKIAPSSIAVYYKNQEISYGELNEKANSLANYLLGKGIKPSNCIALYLSRSADLIVGILATLKIGAAYIPIATDYPEERIRFIIHDAAVSLVLTTSHRVHNLFGIAAPIVALDVEQSKITSSGSEPPAGLEIDGRLPAYIMYTSGSTGRPKGVVISRNSLSYYISWAKSRYIGGLKPQMPLFTSIGFDLTVTSIYLPLISGGNIVIYEEQGNGPDLSLLDVIEHKNLNIIKLTPSHLRLLVGKDYSNSSIKKMIVGGEDFKTNLAAKILQSFGTALEIYNEYGPTEATVGCIVHRFEHEKDFSASVPIGKPAPMTEAYILDERLNPVAEGVPGELYVSGPGISDGYKNLPHLTEERFVINPFKEGEKMYKTGDLARHTGHGWLEYLGRLDEQVKLGGMRIELAEIEALIDSYPGIDSSIVVLRRGVEEAMNQEDVHLEAFYTGTTNASPSAFRAFLTRSLPGPMVPIKYTKLESMPLTANGKADRKLLEKMVTAPASLSDDYLEPDNELEAILVKLWSDVLSLEKVGVMDNFIASGGNSLKAIRLISRINEAFQLRLPVTYIFEYPTIRGFAAQVEATIIRLLDEFD